MNVWHSDPAPHSSAVVHALPHDSGALQVTPQSVCAEQIGFMPPQPSHASGKHRLAPVADALHVVPGEQLASVVHEFRQLVGFAHVIVHAS